MRYQYRVTQYDPLCRDASGAFRKDDWTSFSDIGRRFNGAVLSERDYLLAEAAYLRGLEGFLREAGVASLHLRGLEINANCELPDFVQPLAVLDVAQSVEFARMALREMAWGRLVQPGRAFVHFGWDFYMYLGMPKKCPKGVEAAQVNGLFGEPFRSPYLRKRASLSTPVRA